VRAHVIEVAIVMMDARRCCCATEYYNEKNFTACKLACLLSSSSSLYTRSAYTAIPAPNQKVREKVIDAAACEVGSSTGAPASAHAARDSSRH